MGHSVSWHAYLNSITNPSGLLNSSEKDCSAGGNFTLCEFEGQLLRSKASSQSRRKAQAQGSKLARKRRSGSGHEPERQGARQGNRNGGEGQLGSLEPICAPGPLDRSMLPESEAGGAGLQRVHAMLNAGWPALSFLLSTDLSQALFGGVLGALHGLARTARCYPLRVTRSSPRFRKPPTRHASSPYSMTHHKPPFPAPRSPFSLEGLTG